MSQVATFRKLTLKAAIGNAGRGYRSKEFPNGLDADITTYLSSLIEVKRGAVASLNQTLNGDDSLGFNINHTFIKECSYYPGLMEIITKIEGLIVGSSTHAAAVVLFDDEDILENHCSLMRSPNGDLCTALDLHTVEDAGTIKYDFLLLSTLDIQATTFKLLQQNNVIDPKLTLKECFRKYIDPNKIDTTDPRIWQSLYDNDVLSIFQFDAASGRKGILATRPENFQEMTALNGLIRLMTADGDEDQIERFVRIKNNPEAFEREMRLAGLTEEQIQIMHEELDRYNGCAVTQESFMILSQKLAGYSLKDADVLRKTVAKKKVEDIGKQKAFWDNKMKEKEISKEVSEYLWRICIKPSLGYGFSFNHAGPYSTIGIQCILLGKILFPPIYWQTACLLQRSGALDGKSADYNKIARAVSLLSRQGVNIVPIDINKSERDFTLDVENNKIYFGLAAIKGVKSKVIDKILELRPFDSMLDFMVRTGADITSLTALIKAGAFDNFSSRTESINIISKIKSGIKEELNGRNYLMLSRDGHWPRTSDKLIHAQRVFNFTLYLKEKKYQLDDRACSFLDEVGYRHNGESLEPKQWKYYYDLMLEPMKEYLAENKEEMLNKVNAKTIEDWIAKYFPNNDFAQWEIETMGLCFSPHPLRNVINIDYFEELPQEPKVASIFRTKTGRSVPIYKLSMICGIVIAKDKLHSTITMLTANGPVDVKFRKEQFSNYDSQISRQVNGKKQIVEKSWLNRGVGLIVHGMRQDDLFLAKTYKNSPMHHTAYRIIEVLENGKLKLQKERKKGNQESSEEEDN